MSYHQNVQKLLKNFLTTTFFIQCFKKVINIIPYIWITLYRKKYRKNYIYLKHGVFYRKSKIYLSEDYP